jgi:DNA-directed RNA polymerase subunit beta
VRVNEVRDDELREILEGETVSMALRAGTVEEAIPTGTKLTKEVLNDVRFAQVDLKTFRVENRKANDRIRTIIDLANEEKARASTGSCSLTSYRRA